MDLAYLSQPQLHTHPAQGSVSFPPLLTSCSMRKFLSEFIATTRQSRSAALVREAPVASRHPQIKKGGPVQRRSKLCYLNSTGFQSQRPLEEGKFSMALSGVNRPPIPPHMHRNWIRMWELSEPHPGGLGHRPVSSAHASTLTLSSYCNFLKRCHLPILF